MDEAERAVVSVGWFVALTLTHVPMLIFMAYASLQIVERALGSKRTRTRETLPAAEATPRVCVQLPMLKERACGKRAIDNACALQWPRDLLEVQVLDESGEDAESWTERACAEWRERGIVCNVVRASQVLRGSGRSTKAKALEYGRARTSADFIAVVDADAVLPADYLTKVIPYFYDENGERRSEVAVVQPGLAFVNASENFLTMHQAFKMEADSLVGNRAYIRAFGCPLRTSGAAVWSAAALRAVGGWDQSMMALEGTDMCIRTRMAGYSGKAAANVVVETELPSTLSAYKSQQLRWMGAWAYLAKRHIFGILFNPFNAIGGESAFGGSYGASVARIWFALTIVRPAQWLLLAVWLLVLPELIMDGIWLGNADYMLHGAIWLYLLPLILILKADTFAVSDVEGKMMSPPRSTGEAVKTASSTLRKVSWIAPHVCVSLGMIAVYCTGYVRGFFGRPFPSRDATLNQLRTPKRGDGSVVVSADERPEETSCSTSDVWQLVFELIFILATCRAAIELMRFRAAGVVEAGTLSVVSIIGFGIAASCVYVAAGSWDDKCGPRTSGRYKQRANAVNPEERVGLLSSSAPARGMMALQARKSRTEENFFHAHTAAIEFKLPGRTSDFVIDEESELQEFDIEMPASVSSRDVQKAIKKYKKMRDHEFDLENYSEYAQSDATSVRSEAYVPSHVNFGSSYAPSHEDFSEIGSVIDGAEDERSVDLDGRDRAALAHAVQAERDAQQRAKSLRMANLRINTSAVPEGEAHAWSRPPRSPRDRSAENSPTAAHLSAHASDGRPSSAHNKVIAKSEWVDSPISIGDPPTA